MATMLDSPATRVITTMTSPGVVRAANVVDSRSVPQAQPRGRSLRRDLEMSPAEESARERQQRCFDEALAAAVAVASARSPDGCDGQLTPLRQLEQRVDDMARHILAQAARITRLEEASPSLFREEDHLRVSHLLGRLQEKEGELLRLIQDQQQELEKLRLQQEILANQPCRTREDAEATAAAATHSLQLQLGGLVEELRKLQQEQQVHNCREAGLSSMRAAKHQADVMPDVEMLQELREERGFVAHMLEGVRAEKCEVIAMMHTFAMEKHEAIQELEAIRKAAREEAGTTVTLTRKESARQQLSAQEAALAATKMMATRLDEEAIVLSQQLTSKVNGRDSRASICPGLALQAQPRALQPQTSAALQPAVTVQTASAQQLATPAAPAAYNVQPQRTMGSVPSMQALELNDPSAGLRRCSPVRQYSGVPPGYMPMSLQCSPTVVTRAMDPTRSGVPLSLEAKKSPVRRFVSAGLSPRVLDSMASPGWVSQTSLR